MDRKEKYILARWAVEHAVKSGASEARVIINDSRNNSVSVRQEKIENLEQSIESGMTISLFVDKKYSVHSTNRMDKKEELKSFIEEAIKATRYLAEDEYRRLPDPELYYKGGGPDLKIFDDKFLSVDPGERIDTAYAIEREASGKDERVISVTGAYGDGMSRAVMVTSNGFEGDRAITFYSVTASVSVKQGDARPGESWYESSLFYDRLKKGGTGKTAMEKALKKLGQEKIHSATMPMIIDNRLAGHILSPLIRSLRGSAIQQKNSFMTDMLGEKTGSEKLHLTDDPFIISGHGSRLFDNEGLAIKKRNIFDKGVLKEYYIDTYYGRKLGMQPNSGSTGNLVLQSGDKSQEEMIASLDNAILVSGFNGGNANDSTGDFSYGIEGFLIKGGEIVQPVAEMNITGNLLQLFKDLAETGNDVYEDSAWRTPSLLFDNVNFSGK